MAALAHNSRQGSGVLHAIATAAAAPSWARDQRAEGHRSFRGPSLPPSKSLLPPTHPPACLLAPLPLVQALYALLVPSYPPDLLRLAMRPWAPAGGTGGAAEAVAEVEAAAPGSDGSGPAVGPGHAQAAGLVADGLAARLKPSVAECVSLLAEVVERAMQLPDKGEPLARSPSLLPSCTSQHWLGLTACAWRTSLSPYTPAAP